MKPDRAGVDLLPWTFKDVQQHSRRIFASPRALNIELHQLQGASLSLEARRYGEERLEGAEYEKKASKRGRAVYEQKEPLEKRACGR